MQLVLSDTGIAYDQLYTCTMAPVALGSGSIAPVFCRRLCIAVEYDAALADREKAIADRERVLGDQAADLETRGAGLSKWHDELTANNNAEALKREVPPTLPTKRLRLPRRARIYARRSRHEDRGAVM